MATVLVTGSNKGIGLELCRQLSDRGDEVIAACRTSAPELEALGVRVVPGIDVAQQESVDALAAALGGQTENLHGLHRPRMTSRGRLVGPLRPQSRVSRLWP